MTTAHVGVRSSGDVVGRPRLRRRLWHDPDARERTLLVGAVLLVGLPVLVRTLTAGPYTPDMDRALFELGLRRLGEGHPPSVGAFSRFGWFHPGPALYWLVGGPYTVSGGSGMAIPVTALLVNGVCLAGVALLVRRHWGLPAALWSLVVCLVHLRQLPSGFLVDVWNPYLPVLPFLVAVLLCWASLLGDRWALPAALVVLSICVQAHVGFAPAAAALLALTAAARAGLRFRRRLQSAGRWVWAGTGLVLLSMWQPPLWQQVVGQEGNLGALVTDLWAPKADRPNLDAAVRLVGTELGRLPAFVTGTTPQATYLVPPRLPVWTAVLAVVAFGVALGYAARRRDWSIVALGGLTATVGLAAVVAVTRVRGLLFNYLVQWATVAGILLWVVVGAAIAGAAARALRARRPQDVFAARRWAAAGLCTLALPLVVLVAGGSWALPGNASEPGRLADAVTRWLPSRGDVVYVDYLPTLSPSLLGVTASGAGFVNELDRRDVRLQPPGRRDLGFGPVLKHATGPSAWTVLLGVRNDSPPPPPGFREIAHTETLVLYAGRSAA